MTPDQIKELSLAQKDYVVALRRHFHENPEVSLSEFNTSKRVQEELTSMGIPFKMTSPTGLVANIGNGNCKKAQLRVAMDALPL